MSRGPWQTAYPDLYRDAPYLLLSLLEHLYCERSRNIAS